MVARRTPFAHNCAVSNLLTGRYLKHILDELTRQAQILLRVVPEDKEE